MHFKSLKTNKKSQKQQEKSRGRSMVEMLGVLAIIGVLSIGGIQGYTLAMRKYRANEVVALLSKYATIVYTNVQNSVANGTKTYEVRAHRPLGDSNDVSYYTHPALYRNFSEAGLGGLPQGVSGIWGMSIIPKYTENGEENDFNGAPGEYVLGEIEFNDKRLCNAVANLLTDSLAFDKSDADDSDSGSDSCIQFHFTIPVD